MIFNIKLTIIINQTRRGRPPRGQYDRIRTKIWTGAVIYAAHRRRINLALTFASDRGWPIAWGRYKKGITSPSKKRVEKIAAVLPGTDRYFLTPMWDILENREYTNRELYRAASCLPMVIRRALAFQDEAFTGTFWAKRSNTQSLMFEAYSHLDDHNLAIDFFSTLVLSLRMAERAQDSASYLYAMKQISDGRHKLAKHPVLSAMPHWVYRDLVEPLRRIRFAQETDDAMWMEAREKYLARSKERVDSFDVLNALDSVIYYQDDYDEDEGEDN